MAEGTALFDACVLYPAPLPDLLMRLATTGVFQARWLAAIHQEWTTAVLAIRPELHVQLVRLRNLMDAHVMGALVTGYEPLVETLQLPDPHDDHVLAAAIVGRADVIVTKNLKHFPSDRLEPFGIRAQHPDEFVASLLASHETSILAAVARHRSSLRHPPKSVGEYLDTLLRQELPDTVTVLRLHQTLI